MASQRAALAAAFGMFTLVSQMLFTEPISGAMVRSTLFSIALERHAWIFLLSARLGAFVRSPLVALSFTAGVYDCIRSI